MGIREIRITGTFTTGTTAVGEEAKELVTNLLLKKLEEAKCCSHGGLFSFRVHSVIAEDIIEGDPYEDAKKLLYSPEFNEEMLIEAVTLWLQTKKKLKVVS